MTDFPLPITAWAALVLGTLFFWLTWRVIGERQSGKVAHGDGGNSELAKKIRGQANAAEQMPLGLIVLGLNELLNPTWVTILLAVMLVAGRVIHGINFTMPGTPFIMRPIGMGLTLFSLGFGLIGLAAGLIL
ncbi:MAG: MAPEG family protein [Pseudomonadota bacterium]